MVAGHAGEFAIAEEVGATVADVGDEGAPGDDERGGDGGAHLARVGMVAPVGDQSVVARLDGVAHLVGVMLQGDGLIQPLGGRAGGLCRAIRAKLRQGFCLVGVTFVLATLALALLLVARQGDGGLAAGGTDQWGKRITDRLDGEPAGDFAGVVAAHAIGDDEETGARNAILWNGGVARVFVLIALESDVGFRGGNEAQRHAGPLSEGKRRGGDCARSAHSAASGRR